MIPWLQKCVPKKTALARCGSIQLTTKGGVSMNSMPEKSVNAIDDYLRAIERITGSAPKQSGDEWIGYCPVHEADGKGHKPSLTLKAGDTVP